MHALQSLVSRLRRALGDAGASPGPRGYRLRRRRRRRAASSGSPQKARQRCATATAGRRRAGEALELGAVPRSPTLELRFAAAAAQLRTALALVDRARGGARARPRRGVDELETPRAATRSTSGSPPGYRRAVRRRPPGRRARRLRADPHAPRRRARRRASPDLQAAHLAVLNGDPPPARRPAQEPARRRYELRRPRRGGRAHRRAAQARPASRSSAPAGRARRGSRARPSRAWTASTTACGSSSSPR